VGLLWGAKTAQSPVRLAGHLHHTSAIGDLVASVYAAGRAEYRTGSDDPSPGVPSITAVLPRLKFDRFDQVIEVNQDKGWVMAQGRCRLEALRGLLSSFGLALEPVRTGPFEGHKPNADQSSISRSDERAGGPRTVGAGVIAGEVEAVWVDVLTKDGQLSRCAPGELPADALIVAAGLRLATRAARDPGEKPRS
jgi:hypothetical protein